MRIRNFVRFLKPDNSLDLAFLEVISYTALLGNGSNSITCRVWKGLD